MEFRIILEEFISGLKLDTKKGHTFLFKNPTPKEIEKIFNTSLSIKSSFPSRVRLILCPSEKAVFVTSSDALHITSMDKLKLPTFNDYDKAKTFSMGTYGANGNIYTEGMIIKDWKIEVFFSTEKAKELLKDDFKIFEGGVLKW